ncbi:hypothetical protein [Metabacillus iocasae]|uniref:PH domain-containing protein n=1 Tax=Priestia iocasae TaxID=2291674 RepID=A0ABS2QSA3_9BACI|nr:hypothetical protein [Metabacillus iocasae]MBM7702314.1 hypothetical protein [Metabacillus iocasae]
MSNEEKEKWLSLLQEAYTKGSIEHSMNLTSYMQFLKEHLQRFITQEQSDMKK